MILILGAGFIGNKLYQDLSIRGYRVKLFSRNISLKGYNFCNGDFNEIEKYVDFFAGVTTVIHTIHTTVPATSYENEIFDLETNVVPFIKLLNICKINNVKRFIFLSTGGAIYDVGNDIKTEKSSTNPKSPYGITKLANEKYLLLNKEYFKNGIVILRPSNVYGIGQNLTKPLGIVSHLINAAINKKQIEIWGDGNAIKDYLHVSDFILGVQKVLESDIDNDLSIFNFGYGASFSINDIIKFIENYLGYKIMTIYKMPKKFDNMNIVLDCNLFKKTFNWQPLLSLQDGITDMLNIVNKPNV